MFLIIILLVVACAKWLVYTALLWVMIRVQSLNYNWLGLLGSSLLATGLGYIPVVGPYVAWAALVLCLWKVTQADIAPDVLFTVTIASALMFCVNLFVIGALMGDIRVHPADFAAAGDDDSDDPEEEVVTADAVIPTNAFAIGPPRARVAAPVEKPVSSNAVVVADAVQPANFRSIESLPAKLLLKGVAVNSSRKTAMISAGKEFHTLGIGDKFSVRSTKGALIFTCEDITEKGVILALDGTERVKLTF
jgi:hypothetical protein